MLPVDKSLQEPEKLVTSSISFSSGQINSKKGFKGVNDDDGVGQSGEEDFAFDNSASNC